MLTGRLVVIPPLLALHKVTEEGVLRVVRCIEAADQQLPDDWLAAALRATCKHDIHG